MKRVLWITFALLAMATLSWASVIDFGTSTFAMPTGSHAVSEKSFTLPSLGNLTLTMYATPDGAKLTQDSDYGIGIKYGDGDSHTIDNGDDPQEMLQLHFSKNGVATPVLFSSFQVTNLGDREWDWKKWQYVAITEYGQYSPDNSAWTTFSDSDTNLDTITLTSPIAVTDIYFKAKPSSDYNDFSLKSINVDPAPVPEPAGIILLGTALSALGLWYRRNRA